MSNNTTTYISRALNAKTDETIKKNLKKALEIEPENPTTILLLSKVDKSYESKAFELLERLDETKDYLATAIPTAITLYSRKNDYLGALSFFNKVSKFPKIINNSYAPNINCIQSAYAFLNQNENYKDYLPKKETTFSLLLSLYYEFAVNGEITEASYTNSLIINPSLIGLLISKRLHGNTYLPSILDYNQYNSNNFIYSIFLAIFSKFNKGFLEALEAIAIKTDSTFYYTKNELAVLEVICLNMKGISKKNFWILIEQIKDSNTIYPKTEEILIETKKQIIDLSKEDVKSLISSLSKKSLIETDRQFKPSGLGELIVIKEQEKRSENDIINITKANEILAEGFEAENSMEAIAIFEEAKKHFSKLYIADYFILLNKNMLTYNNLYTLYLKNLSDIEKSINSEIKTHKLNNLTLYYENCFLRISSKLIELSILDNYDDSPNLIEQHFAIFNNTDPQTYIMSYFYAIKTNDKALLRFLKKYDYSDLPTEVIHFFCLLESIEKNSTKIIPLLVKRLCLLNPYIPAILFNFVEIDDELFDCFDSLVDYQHIALTSLEIAANLLAIFSIVYDINPIEEYQNIFLNYIEELVSPTLINYALVFFRSMYSIKVGFTLDEMKQFFKGSLKVSDDLKETPGFLLAKEMNDRIFNQPSTVKEVLNYLMLNQIICMQEKEYRLTLFGVTILNKYFDSNDDANVS